MKSKNPAHEQILLWYQVFDTETFTPVTCDPFRYLRSDEMSARVLVAEHRQLE